MDPLSLPLPFAPDVQSGRIKPEALPPGRFLYSRAGDNDTFYEGQVLEIMKCGSGTYLKLQPGLEWVCESDVFVEGKIPAPSPPPQSPAQIDAKMKRSMFARPK
jgi:hypothetical protein